MQIWNNIATVQMMTGSPERAADAFHKIYAFAQTSNDQPLELLTLFNEANFYIKQGQYQKAITMYLNVLPSLDLKDTRWLEALVLQNLGSAYLQIGDLRNAEVYLEQACEKFKKLGHQGYVSQVEMNLGTLAYLAAQWDRAEVYYQTALLIAHDREDTIIASHVLINLAVLSATQHDFSRALGYAKQANVLVIQSEDSFFQVKILAMLSMIELALLHWQAATGYAERSISLAHKLNDPMAKIASQSVLALTALMNGRRDEAVHDIQRAIDILENLQSSLILSEFKTTFLGQSADIYALASFIAIQEDQLDQAFYFTEKSRARAFLDQIGRQPIKLNQGTAPEIVTQTMTIRQEIIHLESSLHVESTKPLEQQQAVLISDWEYTLEAKQQEYARLLIELKATNPEYALLVSTDSLTLKQVQEQALNDKTTLIVYFTVNDLIGKQTFAWVIDQEMAKPVTLKISQYELQTKVEFFRKSIETRTVTIEDSTILYDDIVAPLQQYIRHKNIIITPHGVLHYLPFAALFDAHEKRYLIENHTISYAHSASAIPLLSSKQNPVNSKVLALGNADGSLPYAADEIKMATHFYKGRSLIGKHATKENLYNEMDTADILHLAVHSHYNQISPLFSRLELAPTLENDGYWEIYEIYESDLRNTNLVILSACDTSLGEFSKGDEIVNLSRAFFYAGVPTVVSTLWAIDDEATAMLMESFYRHLKNGMSNTESLQSAQREIASQEKWHSPYFWAGFVLTGDTYRYDSTFAAH